MNKKIINKETVEQVRKNRKRVQNITPADEGRITQIITDGKRILEKLKKKTKE